MARALLLLFAVVAAASAQSSTDCLSALKKARSLIPAGDCYSKNAVDYEKFLTYPQCGLTGIYPGTYDAAFCDPFLNGYYKCAASRNGLVTPDGKFDTAVFNSKVLSGRCNGIPKYQTAYTKCHADTMKNFNFARLIVCLQVAMA
ncbi:uncharacterized protein LOC108674271 [Hyalella azteca]|uniref:Uncharacterized protein LOC108674271 n=1 Tax=Hyalella azteca TaxID=294128 RepID=A0A8B7NVA4_HYAAZ|nr:uncharacterized protein LOC108674271 [Hyalella azteca]